MKADDAASASRAWGNMGNFVLVKHEWKSLWVFFNWGGGLPNHHFL